jgi:tRNA threonylcarbamoyladenosine biosynthesis protein TsaE
VVLVLPGAEATRDLGRRIGAAAVSGAAILVSGPLGAGKTTLAQGLAAGMGIAQAVTSPTFVLVHEYESPAGTPHLVHADLYRVRARSEVEQLALDEHLDAGAVLLVEWAEHWPAVLGADGLFVELEVSGDSRLARLRGRGAWAERLVRSLAAQ